MDFPTPQPYDDKSMNLQRRAKHEKISCLHEFRRDYSIDLFMSDFEKYFDNEIDFNVKKIRQRIKKRGVLETLVEKAIQNNTHPVTEFVQELFRELGQSGDVKWTGEL